MPNGPTSRETSRKDTGDAVTIGLVLAAVVATFVLFGPVLLKSDQKSVDVVATQPTIHQSKRHSLSQPEHCLAPKISTAPLVADEWLASLDLCIALIVVHRNLVKRTLAGPLRSRNRAFPAGRFRPG